MRIWEEGFPAFEGQQWLTSRFHFHLLAASAGAEGTLLNARRGYYDIKHNLLLELGTGWSLQEDPEGSTSVTSSTSRDFAARADSFGRKKAKLAASLYSGRRGPNQALSIAESAC